MSENELFAKINEGILEERNRIFNMNLNKNLPFIKRFGGVKGVISDFRDKHVIIIGAGSSLGQDLDLLKKYQFRNGLAIIATDMALLPLYKRRILPKYVISCETTPLDYFSSVETNKIHLLAFSCMSNTNLRKWKGNISFYNWMIYNETYNGLWEKAGLDLGFIATGSIVTTQAISLVLGCGIKSLMILGNDMGFKSQYYTKETVVYRNNINKINRFYTFDTAEFNKSRARREFEIHRDGRIYYTNNQFLAAKKWLEDLFKQIRMQTPIYEANGLGCSPQSVEKLSFKKYIENFQKRSARRK